ncbi:hypothetical protein H4CHR_02521 [Variovorax sp. PBS-H4]|uniref:hypothetical protein n=1 Tax=Variovorax sp. PBS-H4 TaxID=434008 RepID=UPI001318C076|nr:hypothetical protein [Variovorax sp. PBS-H4]VTU30014.1 hypothetical protein H4CHR_02521 [Variovorax sp. PBS-H4]
MDIGLAQWRFLLALLTAALLLFVVMWIAWHKLGERREAERRIAAARVRSGHVPLEIPTVRGGLNPSPDSMPDTLPGWFIQGKGEHAVVDEQPRIRLRYVDPHGRKAECTMQVEHLDLQKRLVTGRGELPGETYRIPLHMITGARIVESGQRFNIDTWVDAVRVARRRRGQI